MSEGVGQREVGDSVASEQSDILHATVKTPSSSLLLLLNMCYVM